MREEVEMGVWCMRGGGNRCMSEEVEMGVWWRCEVHEGGGDGRCTMRRWRWEVYEGMWWRWEVYEEGDGHTRENLIFEA